MFHVLEISGTFDIERYMKFGIVDADMVEAFYLKGEG
jgi:hypothetical protein